jgi:hypothetical protein
MLFRNQRSPGLVRQQYSSKILDLAMNIVFVYHHVRGNANVTNIAVMVVQFFGGVQLGR